jgi:hypothetical protein
MNFEKTIENREESEFMKIFVHKCIYEKKKKKNDCNYN